MVDCGSPVTVDERAAPTVAATGGAAGGGGGGEDCRWWWRCEGACRLRLRPVPATACAMVVLGLRGARGVLSRELRLGTRRHCAVDPVVPAGVPPQTPRPHAAAAHGSPPGAPALGPATAPPVCAGLALFREAGRRPGVERWRIIAHRHPDQHACGNGAHGADDDFQRPFGRGVNGTTAAAGAPSASAIVENVAASSRQRAHAARCASIAAVSSGVKASSAQAASAVASRHGPLAGWLRSVSRSSP